MRRAVVAAFLDGARMRQVDRLARHLALRVRAALGDFLHDVTVAIPSDMIHPAVDIAGILTQGPLDNAHRLDELTPVHGSEETEAADAVAHRDLVSGQLLGLHVHRLFDGQAGLGQSLFDPGQRQCQRRALALQTACEFGHKRVRHRRIRAGHVGHRQNQALGVLLGDHRHLIGPLISAVAQDPVGGDSSANPPNILDQGQTKHDGDGPQFTEL